MMGFENNLAQMIIMTRRYVANKNLFARSKVKVTFVFKLCAYTSVKPVRVGPITLLCIVGFENNLAQMIIMTRRCVANKNLITRSKVKVIFRT